MIPAWPSSLWQQPARGRWSGGPRDERAVFSPEIGPPLSRRRTTGETRAFEATFPNFTGVMRQTFETWVRDDLRGGVKRFSWRDPVSDEIGLWQIVASGELAYSFTANGADRHQLSLNLTRMPGTPWWAGYALPGDNCAPYAVADYAGTIFGVDGARSTAAAVAEVAGTFDVATLDHVDIETLQLGRVFTGADRTNLLLRSQEFDNAAWTKTRASISADAANAPDGTPTADKLIEDSTAANTHSAQQAVTTTASTTYTLSVYAKAAERDKFRLTMGFGGGAVGEFDLTAETADGFSGGTASIEAVGSDWYRCSVAAPANDASMECLIYLRDAAGNTSYTGDGSSGLYVWGAQLEEAGAAGYYIPTTTAAGSATDGIPAVQPPGIKRISAFLP